MPPRSPLPQRHGLDPAWLCTPSRERGVPERWATMGSWLRDTLPAEAMPELLLREGRFVYHDGSAVGDDDPYRQHVFVWFHRELRDEAAVPGEIVIVHHDARIVVIDKPPFLSSIPRGRHVMQSAVVKLRERLRLPELTPAHRLDRVTSGLLLFTTEQRWRGSYQTLFQEQRVQKVYRAIAPIDPALNLPRTVENHIAKQHGVMQAEVVPGAPVNARTLVELEADLGDGTGRYRLTPATGRTHQLRLHMNGLGVPIVNDPHYPVSLDVGIDDFTSPLQLLASELAFTDPVDGLPRHFLTARSLPIV